MKPILFTIFGLGISSYSFFMLAGLIAAGVIIVWESRRKKLFNENLLYLFLAALLGGALGAKIPIWIYYKDIIIADIHNLELIFSGRTVVGGIIGGWIAVEIVKKYLSIKRKTGDIFAPALALGVSIGRIGCYLKGCCYGVASTLPWAADFGDGTLRHPTQLYSSIFNFLLFVYLWSIRKKVKNEGDLFYIYLFIYFTFRFFIEFIRVTPKVFLGLSGFQLVAVMVIVYVIYKKKLLIKGNNHERERS